VPAPRAPAPTLAALKTAGLADPQASAAIAASGAGLGHGQDGAPPWPWPAVLVCYLAARGGGSARGLAAELAGNPGARVTLTGYLRWLAARGLVEDRGGWACTPDGKAAAAAVQAEAERARAQAAAQAEQDRQAAERAEAERQVRQVAADLEDAQARAEADAQAEHDRIRAEAERAEHDRQVARQRAEFDALARQQRAADIAGQAARQARRQARAEAERRRNRWHNRARLALAAVAVRILASVRAETCRARSVTYAIAGAAGAVAGFVLWIVWAAPGRNPHAAAHAIAAGAGVTVAALILAAAGRMVAAAGRLAWRAVFGQPPPQAAGWAWKGGTGARWEQVPVDEYGREIEPGRRRRRW
jgi:hypothetical protein